MSRNKSADDSSEPQAKAKAKGSKPVQKSDISDAPTPASRVEQKKANKKQALLAALRKTGGMIYRSCKTVGVSPDTYYRLMDEDPAFAAEVKEIIELEIDDAEIEIKSLRADPDPRIRLAANKLLLDAKARGRGFGTQKQEQHHTGGMSVVYVKTPRNNRGPGPTP